MDEEGIQECAERRRFWRESGYRPAPGIRPPPHNQGNTPEQPPGASEVSSRDRPEPDPPTLSAGTTGVIERRFAVVHGYEIGIFNEQEAEEHIRGLWGAWVNEYATENEAVEAFRELSIDRVAHCITWFQWQCEYVCVYSRLLTLYPT